MKLLFILLSFQIVFAGSIEVMTYNVENLFDTIHDGGKNDWTFLPTSPKKSKECKKIKKGFRRKECFDTNWTSEHLQLKLEQIRDVVLKNRVGLPDILGLVEIENERVVSKLAKILGYKKFVISNSPDKRGIDVAVLYKESANLKFINKRELILVGDYFDSRPTRNILEVEFLVNGKFPLYVFENHWPSLGNPDHARIFAAKTLRDRFSDLARTKPGFHAVAMGDFNTIPTLKRKANIHPFRDMLLLSPIIRDLHTQFIMSPKIKTEVKLQMAPGSYYYSRGNAWNLLDRVFISESLLDGKGLEVEISSYKIYAPDFITGRTTRYFTDNRIKQPKQVARSFARPMRYDHKASRQRNAGYSDHFPIIYNLRF